MPEPQEPKVVPALAETLAHLLKLPGELVLLIVRGIYLRWRQADLQRRNGFRVGIVLLLGLGSLAWSQELYLPSVPRRDLVRLLENHCWVTYDPTGIDPRSGAEPTAASIRRDLSRIRSAGFTGVVTFSSRGSFARIPSIAKTEQLAVIMGVWSPGDVGELRNAISQREFADGYCVGHDGLDKRDGYVLEDLGKAIALLKRRTRRPVTTSEEVRFYQNPALLRLGDWLFPDAHSSLLDAESRSLQAGSQRATGSIVVLAKEISTASAEADRPLMLKMVAFPWNGLDGASLESQRACFDDFLQALRSPQQGIAVRPAVVIHSAFDLPWKQGYPFYEWDPYTGVLNADGSPRPAARVIAARCP